MIYVLFIAWVLATCAVLAVESARQSWRTRRGAR